MTQPYSEQHQRTWNERLARGRDIAANPNRYIASLNHEQIADLFLTLSRIPLFQTPPTQGQQETSQ